MPQEGKVEGNKGFCIILLTNSPGNVTIETCIWGTPQKVNVKRKDIPKE
jgi:hypothetical protein